MKTNKILYTAEYKKEKWICEINTIKQKNNIITYTVNGRGSKYEIYLMNFENKMWIDIPIMKISSELSTLDDTFWNSEQIGIALKSYIDGITIANSLKIVGKEVGII